MPLIIVIQNNFFARHPHGRSDNIRTYRLQRKLTQAALAARVGKQRVTITRYELGGIDFP
jgi:DNA-binding XRE family transcriptional regulator